MITMDKMGGALSDDGRAALETHVLPAYLPHRRWFSAKGDPVLATRLLYCVRLPGAEDVWLGEVAAHFHGHSQIYTLPLAASWDDDASPLARQLALSPLRDGDRAGLLTDAFAVDGLAYATLALLRAGATLELPDGQRLRFLPTSALMESSLAETPTIRRLSAEQSNSSLILGDAVVLKLVRHVAAGINPESEVTRVLTERGFANCAPLFGEVVRISADGTPHTVMLAQGFLRNQGDGWEWTLRALGDGGDALDRLNEFCAKLGQRLAELHAILARPTDESGFAPEPADDATRLAWAQGATAQLELALDLLRMPRELSDHDAACAGWLLDNAEPLSEAIRRLAALGEGAMNHRVHGDFHLGQVLVSGGDAYIVDFEGEPARTLAQRREKSCAMRDVAGLLRSFDYAAATAAMRHEGSPHIRPACARAERAFMTAYQATLARATDTPVPPAAQAPLLDLFLIEKAAYEIRYEATNRPTCMSMTLTDATGAPDAGAVAAIVAARHGEPFAVLGHHDVDGGCAVRAFVPDAEEIDVVARESGAVLARLHRIDSAGFWSGVMPSRAPYRLRIRAGAREREIEDPYSFGQALSEFDIHLLAEGRHHELGRVLGAHLDQHEGVRGVRFAVWAPNARRVSVVGSFNAWDGRQHPMRLHHGAGIWELFIPRLTAGMLYKYEIVGPDGTLLPLKADPVAAAAELPPATASIVTDERLRWRDVRWRETFAARQAPGAPISIYEVHAASWLNDHEGSVWDQLTERLVPYVQRMGFTHVELMPIMEHPFGGSWGYQPLGQFAPSAHLGSPEAFAAFVDRCHEADIGVILDWVPAHFPGDAHGLARFDGTALYEHADPREGFHQDWGTYIYNLGRNEVRGFLIGSALHWLEHFHIDGLRVDAVASMLYRDYSRRAGEWIPNVHGGRENLESVAFLQELSRVVSERCPGAVLIAEESTAWPGVTRTADEGGLGFHYKWNMGWMHDTLHYMQETPVYRRWHHGNITFGLVYAFSERFVLPLSHDEVVYGKGSLIGKMPGDSWQRFANLRAYLGLMWTHPGKKLLFMGGEFAQEREWNHDAQLDWAALDDPRHAGVQRAVRDLNHLYRATPALFRRDADPSGFRWVIIDDRDNSVFAYLRRGDDGDLPVLVLCNLTPVPRYDYRVGVPRGGDWREVFNSDADIYGGGNVGNGGLVVARQQESHGLPASLNLTLPPLACLVLQVA